ncbi:MAG: hypothetical protein BroJett005_05340 [Ignavibacteriota bacterium]|nr:MAG: hypothetical protein BroJett005_05340 [Ignavibacteriota bacterium]
MYKQYLIFILLLAVIKINPQTISRDFSISMGVDYTTSAQIFLNPNSSDIIIRNRSFELLDLFSPYIDIRYRLNESLMIGIGTEYVKRSEEAYNLNVIAGSQVVTLKVDDGVKFIPIELSVYYYLPFSTEHFNFTMGGGIGYYIGEQTRKFGDTEIEMINRKFSLGLLVSIGMEYLIIPEFGLRLDLKFRDPEIKLTNKYKSKVINYNGNEITLLLDTFNSKINLNGIAFFIGAVYYF